MFPRERATPVSSVTVQAQRYAGKPIVTYGFKPTTGSSFRENSLRTINRAATLITGMLWAGYKFSRSGSIVSVGDSLRERLCGIADSPVDLALSGARLYWEHWGKGYFNAKVSLSRLP